MGITLRKVFAFIVAFLVAGGLGELLKLLGPVLAGWTIMAFDISPIGANGVGLLESIGNIVAVFLMLYVGIKVYKRITRVKEDKATE